MADWCIHVWDATQVPSQTKRPMTIGEQASTPHVLPFCFVVRSPQANQWTNKARSPWKQKTSRHTLVGSSVRKNHRISRRSSSFSGNRIPPRLPRSRLWPPTTCRTGLMSTPFSLSPYALGSPSPGTNTSADTATADAGDDSTMRRPFAPKVGAVDGAEGEGVFPFADDMAS
jgi:hypothetical protein